MTDEDISFLNGVLRESDGELVISIDVLNRLLQAALLQRDLRQEIVGLRQVCSTTT